MYLIFFISYNLLVILMKYIKYSILSFILIFSFYISDKLLLYVESLSPIMKEINNYDFKEEKPVNAIIEGDKIIPGKNGKRINKRESYLKMNDFGKFNETFFVYDYIKPDISLIDNNEKIIIKGNKKDLVSIIVNNNYDYFINNNIKFTYIVSDIKDVVNSDVITYINSFYDDYDFLSLNSKFKRNKINDRICLFGKSNLELCKKKDYFIVKPSIEINSNNIIDILNIKGGDILFLDKDLSLEKIKYIISNIKYNNLKIVKLSELISE